MKAEDVVFQIDEELRFGASSYRSKTKFFTGNLPAAKLGAQSGGPIGGPNQRAQSGGPIGGPNHKIPIGGPNKGPYCSRILYCKVLNYLKS